LGLIIEVLGASELREGRRARAVDARNRRDGRA
jgi:hypothetical protein